MPLKIISATIRGIEFRIRADWNDPASAVRIESEDGFDWQDTGDTVGDWTPADLDAPRLVSGGFSSSAAAAAIAGVVLAHFDHPRWQTIPEASIVAAATVKE